MKPGRVVNATTNKAVRRNSGTVRIAPNGKREQNP